MKRMIGIAAFLMASLLVGSALAQDGAPERRGRRRDGERGERRERRERREGAEGRQGRRGEWRGDRAERGKAAMDKVLAELELSTEKRAQVEQILKTHHQAVANWTKEHVQKVGELRQQIAEARKAGNRGKARELVRKIRELNQGRQELRKNLLDQLGQVLTKEQLAKVKEVLTPRRRRSAAQILRAIKKLDLTVAQQAAMKKIMAEGEVKVDKARDPRARMQIATAAMEKVVKDVLTDAQRKKLPALIESVRNRRRRTRRIGHSMLRGLDLTPEQQEKIRDIEDTFREARRKANSFATRREANRVRIESTRAVLTKEQLEKLDEKKEPDPAEIERRRRIQQREMDISD